MKIYGTIKLNKKIYSVLYKIAHWGGIIGIIFSVCLVIKTDQVRYLLFSILIYWLLVYQLLRGVIYTDDEENEHEQ